MKSKYLLRVFIYIFILDIVIVLHELIHSIAIILTFSQIKTIEFIVHYILITEGSTCGIVYDPIQDIIIALAPAIVITSIFIILSRRYPDIALLILASEVTLLMPPSGDIIKAFTLAKATNDILMFLMCVIVASSIFLGIGMSLYYMMLRKDCDELFKTLLLSLLVCVIVYLVMPPIKIKIIF